MRRAWALVALALVLVPSARAGFELGIADSQLVPATEAAELGLSTYRLTLRWRGEDSYQGELRLPVGLRPLLMVGMVYDAPPVSDDEQAAYCTFVSGLVARYPIRDVYLWGEPRTVDFGWYARLLRRCSPLLRLQGARVIGPALGPWTMAAPASLYAALRQVPHLLDGVGVDPYYGYGYLPGFIRGLRSALGWRVPVYVAEDGIDTEPDPVNAWQYTGGTPRWWNYWTTEAGQAAVVRAHMTLAYCSGTASWTNFLLRDERNLAQWQSGLERPDGSHKPAYQAFVQTGRLLTSGAYKCPESTPPPPPLPKPYCPRRDRADAPHWLYCRR